MALDLYIDIENSAGQRQGSGPITSASKWRYTARMDKAGSFDFEMPATDAKAVNVRRKYIARAYAYIDGQRIEVGAGIIDRIEKQPQADGTVALRVSGDDLVRELTYRSVLDLKLYLGGNPVSHATALTATSAYAPAGWTFTPDGSPPNDLIYGYFNGETVLAAMIKVADKSQNHFYRGVGRSLVFASSFTPSGVRAIQARGNLSANTCAIVSLTEQVNTYDLITRIYPRGSGNANVQLNLRATTRTAPAGFTLDKINNYIENDAAVTDYGQIERQVDFRDIGPIDNTSADIQAASNALFDAALETLKRQSTELEQATYALQVADCKQLLRPMQSIQLVNRDLEAGLDINQELNILEATWQVDSSGLYTTDMVVSNADRWPKTDVGTIVDNIAQGNVYQALPQLNANAYTTGYSKNVDADNVAEFRFRIGDEVTQLQQVLFEFQILPFESTIRSVSSATTTTDSGGGSSPSSTSDGSHSHTYTIPAHGHTYTYTIPTHSHTYTYTIPSHSHTYTYTIPAHSHTFTYTIPGHGHTYTYTIPGHTHTITIADHDHSIAIYDTATPGSPSNSSVSFDRSNNIFIVSVSGTGTADYAATTNGGGGETVVASQSSSTSGATTATTSETNSANSTTQLSQTATGATTTAVSQTATAASSTALSQTVTGATTTLAAATGSTTDGGGTHSHTVTIPAHSHSVTASLSTVYGIFRESSANTYDIGELEWRINGGAWGELSDAEAVDGDWYSLDITDLVADIATQTFRPLQAGNLIEVRGTTTNDISQIVPGIGDTVQVTTTGAEHGLLVGASVTIAGTTNYNGTYTVTSIVSPTTFAVDQLNFGSEFVGTYTVEKTATIDAQLSVRNVIQAVAYS